MVKRKGVVLAGGSGTRLRPFTLVLNKHLLPVFDRPMVTYPINTLKELGIRNICVVTGNKDLKDFVKVLKNGKELGVSITYKTQTGPEGIADALMKARGFFKKDKIVAILGDDIFRKIHLPRKVFEDNFAYVLVTKAGGYKAVAVPEIDRNGKIVRIEEKPKVPKSDLMIIGFYIYPSDVFDFIKKLKPSMRGELELTDVNNWYLSQGRLRAVKTDALIGDAGTPDNLLRISIDRAKKSGMRL